MPFPITLEEFFEAYKMTGAKPVRSMWIRNPGTSPGDCTPFECCPLGAVLCSRMGAEATYDLVGDTTPDDSESSMVARKLRELGFDITPEQVSRFTSGVDSGDTEIDDEQPEAFQFGQKVYLELTKDQA